MEEFPVEVVGIILSRTAAARDVLLASATCRKWRRAFREHLTALSFEMSDLHGFHHDIADGDVAIMITGTILQTTGGLQSLTIAGDRSREFSPSVVLGWLMYVRQSLLELCYKVDCEPDLDVARICRCEKLEKLSLFVHTPKFVDRESYAFTSLRWLELEFAEFSEQDLTALLSACPKLEKLELVGTGMLLEAREMKLEVRAPNLREFTMKYIALGKLTIESDNIEHLELNHCYLGYEFFRVIHSGSLRKIRMFHTTVFHLEISGSAENLEKININGSLSPESEFYLLLSKSSKLGVLRLWDFAVTEAIDLEMIAMSCPQLSCLDLSCRIHTDDKQFPYYLRGPTTFQNVVSLKLGWLNTDANQLCDFIESLLERCPRLKKLTLVGQKQVMTRHNRCISRIKRKCTALNVKFAPFYLYLSMVSSNSMKDLLACD